MGIWFAGRKNKMNNILKKFKSLEIDVKQLRDELGNDLYNILEIKAEKVCAKDVCFIIEQYLSGKITMQTLLDWINIVWFTDLYVYNSPEEDSIASVMTALETMDEDGVNFTSADLSKMIDCLKTNTDYDG